MRIRSKFPYVFLAIILLLTYLPIVLVIIYSFNDSKLTSLWGGFTFKWYADLFKDKAIFKSLYNSIILATLSSLLAGIIGTLGAVGMPMLPFKSKKIVEYISTLPIMVPEIILGIVFLTFFSLLKIPLGMITLVIGHTSFCIPYVYTLVKSSLVGIDSSYVEAARDLGAGEFKAFSTVTLPLVAPAIISGMILSFVMSFDDVIISVFVSGVESNTLPLYVYTQLKTGVTPKIYALCSLMFAISVLLIGLSTLMRKLGNRKKVETTAVKLQKAI